MGEAINGSQPRGVPSTLQSPRGEGKRDGKGSPWSEALKLLSNGNAQPPSSTWALSSPSARPREVAGPLIRGRGGDMSDFFLKLTFLIILFF